MIEFRIADTFTDSLARLTGQEQKAVKTTAFDLQLDPSAPGLSFHKLDRAQDKNFWSVRVNADIRLIVHRTPSSLLLAYVAHHDPAYKWAERRKIERHPTTGAMQLVEVRERVQEIEVFAPKAAVKPKLFDNLRKFELMSFGVPEEWVDDVRRADEDSLFDIIKHLPQEAQEALLKLAVGEQPEVPKPAPVDADPFAHPDAQRRFRVLTNAEELQRALDYPWEKWAVFLHPAQQALVERDFAGPARVSGSAGTGKTIVALHRAVHLAKTNTAAKVLLTTFSTALANSLKGKLVQLVSNDPAVAARMTVKSVRSLGMELYSEVHGKPVIAPDPTIRALLTDVAAKEGVKFSPAFLWSEWVDVVDAWQVTSQEEYAQVARLGRKTRLGEKQREVLWRVFAQVRAGLAASKMVTWPEVFARLTADLEAETKPFDFVVIDEAQDIGIPEAKFFSALAAGGRNGLFLAGDLGQRIFQQPFSMKSLGIDVRGRSAGLRINYRTSHQIRSHADKLLPKEIADVDGLAESRKGTVSMFDGPEPVVRLCDDAAAEREVVRGWIMDRLREGYRADEIAIFVRSEAEVKRALDTATAAGLSARELTEEIEVEADHVAICTMHLAKGLEFRAVVVMACDEDVLPLQERIDSVSDDADLEDMYVTERHLLYVACTRARDSLLVTGVSPGSEFLSDF
jgi:mRNA-degrading endonuclease RelE of RelBE toxin-antitoxin system